MWEESEINQRTPAQITSTGNSWFHSNRPVCRNVDKILAPISQGPMTTETLSSPDTASKISPEPPNPKTQIQSTAGTIPNEDSSQPIPVAINNNGKIKADLGAISYLSYTMIQAQ